MENTDNNTKTKAPEPILPEPGKRNILITSSLPYVNNVPHLGNIVGSTLSADVFSRYCKLRGINAIYICGTDEYGTATEAKAAQEGVTPQQICDKYFQIHKEVYDWFDIKFDKFGRTSTANQTKIAQDIFLNLHKNNNLVEDTMQQLYCENHQKFLSDRFVEGTCPYCGFDDARGDQCDNCTKLINAVELIKPRCKLDGSTPIIRSTKHFFLDLPKLTARLEKWVEESAVLGKWSSNAIQTTRAWIKQGLEPRCITRDLKWGTPVPLEEYKDKVFYVWFDAPIGYISITANYTEHWEKWWRNPEQTQLYQFMGKDNIPFHTVVFPASLIGTDQKWTLLHHVSTTEYLNYEGGKFSKSRGTGVFGTDAKSSGIPSEVWRYYLLINRPETSDSSFSWDDLLEKTNSELLSNLGNFVNRALSFVAKEFDGAIPAINLNEDDKTFIASVNNDLKEYIDALDGVHIKDGLKIAMGISRLGNKYFQDHKPWDLAKNDKSRCATVIGVAANLTKLLAAILEPYIPATSVKIYQQLNIPEAQIFDSFKLDLPVGHKIGVPQVLFKKITEDEIKELRSKFGGKQEKEQIDEDAFPIDLRGATIVSVDDHPGDENLYVVKVDVGKEQRQVVARLKGVYKKEELLNRNVVVLCNLPVADIRGSKSEAMMLVAEGKKGKETIQKLLQTQSKPSTSWPGTKIIADGAKENVKPNITLKEFQKLDLKLDKEGKVVFRQKFVLKTESEKLTLTSEVQGPAKIK